MRMLAPQRGQRQAACGELVRCDVGGGPGMRAAVERAREEGYGERWRDSRSDDADEASGQHMLAEAAQELARG